MILDSSVLVAILRHESDAHVLAAAIEDAEEPAISAVTLVEASIVVGPHRHQALDDVLHEGGVTVVPLDEEQGRVARDAYVRYGKGSGSPARLNLGDCFPYALAAVTGRPLLYKGDDFRHTDVRSALD